MKEKVLNEISEYVRNKMDDILSELNNPHLNVNDYRRYKLEGATGVLNDIYDILSRYQDSNFSDKETEKLNCGLDGYAMEMEEDKCRNIRKKKPFSVWNAVSSLLKQ